ncbi:hypothetical protein M9434_004143 [Picochlorum sp. BPE23]|nr:hypothetical protein M9434_004143 [Picochlorum sp. BPE23]
MVSTRARKQKAATLPITAEVESKLVSSKQRVDGARDCSGQPDEAFDLLPPLLPSLKEFVVPGDGSDGHTVVNWPYWKPRVKVPSPLLESPSDEGLLRAHALPSKGDKKTHPQSPAAEGSDSLEELLMDTLKNNYKEDEEVNNTVAGMPKKKTAKQKKQHIGADSAKDQTIYLALQKTGFSSWSHLIETIFLMAKKLPKGKDKSDVTLSHVLNGHSPFYHAGFARAYQNLRQSLRKHAIELDSIEKLQKHSTLIQSWSDLSAEEHSWFLTHQHQRCTGQDAVRFKNLERRVLDEQMRYTQELDANAECHTWRYDHITERQIGQLHADDDRRRQRIFTRFPPVLEQKDAISIPKKRINTGKDASGVFEFVAVLRTQGGPLGMQPLDPGTPLPGDKHYMPAIDSYNRTRGVYKKKECEEIDTDPIIEDILANEGHMFKDATMVLVATAGVFQSLMASDWSHTRRDIEIPYSSVVRKSRKTEKVDIVYLHKPLMPKSMTMREKQTRLQKYAVLSNSMTNAQRQTAYCLWKHSKSGTYIILRSHGLVCTDGNVPSSVLSIKPEYLPEPDRECITDQETCLWKARLCLSYPVGARHIQVAHVSVPKGRILSWSVLDAPHQMTGCIDLSQDSVRFWCPSMDAFITWAVSVDSKSVLWTSSAGLDSEKALGLAQALPSAWNIFIPSSDTPEKNPYHLHKAHQSSTTTNVISSQWIPPIWRPYSESMAQIPNTFPPKLTKPSATAKIPRKRVRKTPWQGDVDKVHHISTISRKEYMDHLSAAL